MDMIFFSLYSGHRKTKQKKNNSLQQGATGGGTASAGCCCPKVFATPFFKVSQDQAFDTCLRSMETKLLPLTFEPWRQTCSKTFADFQANTVCHRNTCYMLLLESDFKKTSTCSVSMKQGVAPASFIESARAPRELPELFWTRAPPAQES